MTSPWLDTRRFPGRAHLAAIARHHAPLDRSQAIVEADFARGVQLRWAESLHVDPADLVLVGSEAEAFRLVLHGLLAPGDVALVAGPAPVAGLAAILAAGAQFVDVGRLHDGRIDRQALERALEVHPEAVLLAEQPSLFGTDDAEVLGDLPVRARILAAAQAQGWLGPRALDPLATATIVALRDPDLPQVPVFHAVVCARGTGADLMLLQGPAAWPEAIVRQALAVLDGLRDRPDWPARTEARLDRHHATWVRALTNLPGVRILPRAGWRAAAECLAGNSEEVAKILGQVLAPVQAFAAHPMRSLVVAHLGRVHALGVAAEPALPT